MRLIDADALEKDGWRMNRNVQINKQTMEFQTRKPTDFPTIESEPIRLRLDHELSKEEYERLKKDCAEQPVILFPKESAQPELAQDLPNACTDAISRQAAISIPVLPKEHREYQTMNLDDAYELGWYDLQKYIEKMPSTQPEIIRCDDCVHWWESHKMCKRNKDKNHNCACMDCDAEFYCKNAERREE